MSDVRTFRCGYLFCGLGAGALGFMQAAARLGPHTCQFVNLGGIDIDPLACADFEYLTGSRATCADISKMQTEDMQRALGNESPDALFLSPPCVGFSGLLSKAASLSPKYQALNRLVLQGMFLACETWTRPPGVIVIENVPRIMTRGKELLDQVRQLLQRYGYKFHEATHDCGEVGGLAQHRKRYLMVARHPARVPGYIYRPLKKRVRACGEVLETLPMPEDPSAGQLHELPAISMLNWVRLAMIPAGGDWRDLPKGPVVVSGDPTRDGSFKGRPDAYGVQRWDEPAKAVRGKMVIAHAPAAVADPRIEVEKKISDPTRGGALGVIAWDQPAPTVTGAARVSGSNMPAAVADPRLTSPVKDGEERRAHFKRYHVAGWEEPARVVAGSGTNGNYGVADPRVKERPGRFSNQYKMRSWEEPAGCVTGDTDIQEGAQSVADPRIGLDHEPRRGSYGVQSWDEPADTVRGHATVRQAPAAVADPRVAMATENPDRHWNKYSVEAWDEPSRTVIGATRPGSGSLAVADPRLNCTPRRGVYGVMSWEEAAATITGNARIDNGCFAVADPRKPPPVVPVIIAADGTWHRPMTTLELAALQGIPVVVRGKPLQLAGKNTGKIRSRIGNAVPVQAGQAVAATVLTALLAGQLGCWSVGAGGVWVRDDGKTEDEVNAEYEQEACHG